MSDTCGSRKGGVSVIIPHGGESRFPQLAATLPALRQCTGVHEVIVVELAESPRAERLARRWADKYVFARHTALFDRARALNIGIPFAAHELLLWQDNVLVLPDGFVLKAAAEMRARSLDFLTPYTSGYSLAIPAGGAGTPPERRDSGVCHRKFSTSMRSRPLWSICV